MRDRHERPSNARTFARVCAWIVLAGSAAACGSAPAPATAEPPTAPIPPAAIASCDPAVRPASSQQASLFLTTGDLQERDGVRAAAGRMFPGDREMVSIGDASRDRRLPGYGVTLGPQGRAIVYDDESYLLTSIDALPIPLELGVGGVAFADDGRFVGQFAGEIVSFDASGALLHTIPDVHGFASLEVRGELVLVLAGTGPVAAYRLDDLSTVFEISPDVGPGVIPSPSERYIASLAFESDGTYPGTARLTVIELTTGERVVERTVEPPIYDRTGLHVFFTPDEQELVWLDAARMHRLRIDNGAVHSIPQADVPGEPDTHTIYVGAFSQDGRHACFAMDSADVVTDGRTGAVLQERIGRALRCAVRGHAVVLDLTLQPQERVVNLPGMGFGIYPDFALSSDGDTAALVVGVASKGERTEYRLLIADVSSQKVLHRISLGSSELWTTFQLTPSDDGRFVQVDSGVPDVASVTVELATGETRPVDHDGDGDGGAATTALTDAVAEAGLELGARQLGLAGETMVFELTHGWYVAHLGEPGLSMKSDDFSCGRVLSPRGTHLLLSCRDEQVVWRIADHKRIAAVEGSSYGSWAVSDEGVLALAVNNRLEQFDGDGAITGELTTSGGGFSHVAWSPDGRSIAALHAAEEAIYVVDRGATSARWKTEVPGADAVRFSIEGRAVVAGLGYGATRILDAEDGKSAVPKNARELIVRFRDARGQLIEHAIADAGTAAEKVELGETGWHRLDERQLSLSVDKRWLLVSDRDLGVVRVIETRTSHLVATLVPSRAGVIVVFEDGRIDHVGDPKPLDALSCVEDEHASPWGSCRDSYLEPGAWQRMFGNPNAGCPAATR